MLPPINFGMFFAHCQDQSIHGSRHVDRGAHIQHPINAQPRLKGVSKTQGGAKNREAELTYF